eukprot:jgi/Chrzof1/7389/Cz02g21290.t1
MSVEIRPLFSQTCTARIQKFPDGSGSPQIPRPTKVPTLKHRPQHRAEDTELPERLRQQISIKGRIHPATNCSLYSASFLRSTMAGSGCLRFNGCGLVGELAGAYTEGAFCSNQFRMAGVSPSRF